MVENCLRAKRIERGLSQKAVAKEVGLTRQALYSIESNHYLPSTEISLRLAKLLKCRVEDLFCLDTENEMLEAHLVGSIPTSHFPVRAKMARVGNRLIAKTLGTTSDVFNFMVPAEGLLLRPIIKKPRGKHGLKVPIQLLQDRQVIEEAIVVAGCDPAMHLAAEHYRRHRAGASVAGWTMGSAAAVEALKRQEVHMAGLHLVDDRSGQSNLPYLKKHLDINQFTVIRFATWVQGLIVRRGNPKSLHRIEDLTRRDVRLVNREIGSGARVLLDGQLTKAGLPTKLIKGYGVEVSSHLDVARAIAEGQADIGVGVGSAALLFDLDFLPLREEHYDFVFPTSYLTSHPTLSQFLDVLVSGTFRKEMEAFGGYNVQEIGKILDP